MPTRALRPCAATATCPHCQPCPVHGTRHAQVAKRRGSSTQQGYGARWRRLRAQVLREEPLCRACLGVGRVAPATEVDHIVPRSKGGPDDRANLQSLCKSHHSEKTKREAAWSTPG